MPNMKDDIATALENLRVEANYPLIRFAKAHLDLDIEKGTRSDIIEWAKHLIMLNGDFALSKKILSSLDNAIEYVQKAIYNYKPNYAKSFFNFVKDKYASKVVSSYLAEKANKEKLVDKTVDFAKHEIIKKVLHIFDKNKVQLEASQFKNFKAALTNLIKDIEDNSKTLTNIAAFKTAMQPLSDDLQKKMLDRILQKQNIKEDSLARFKAQAPSQLIDSIQSKVNALGLQLVKKAQAQEIYKYDGLVERYLPASVRGLHDIDRSIVEGIALKGDTSKVQDLFNFEVASHARYNPEYKVGHTGASNRSSTALANIAMYFASAHGLKHVKPGEQAPKSIWIMLYEPTKGINTTELVDKSVNWTEFEFATPELKAQRCLGAVKFELDPATNDKNNIGFKAVDGFVVPRVHEGNYKKEGVEGDIKNMLDMAKYFDKPNTNTKPILEFKLPRNDRKVSQNRTFFQKIFDKLGLSHNEDTYVRQRKAQLKMVQNESAKEKEKRLKEEKASLSFWQQFSEQVNYGFTKAKAWLPSFNKLVYDMPKDQQRVVKNGLKNKLKAK